MTKRRPLDALGAAFVHGGDTPPAPPPETKPAPKAKTKAVTQKRTTKTKTRAIDKLMQTAEQERQVRITVDLDKSQHQQLTVKAAQIGSSKADIIRALLDDFLSE